MTESADTTLPAGADLADLVCADPALLRLEFDSIIAANYPASANALDPRPPRRPPSGWTGYRPWTGHIRDSAAESREPAGPGEPRPRPRQRGPPRSARPPIPIC
jgi:hypothetical protein